MEEVPEIKGAVSKKVREEGAVKVRSPSLSRSPTHTLSLSLSLARSLAFSPSVSPSRSFSFFFSPLSLSLISFRINTTSHYAGSEEEGKAAGSSRTHHGQGNRLNPKPLTLILKILT